MPSSRSACARGNDVKTSRGIDSDDEPITRIQVEPAAELSRENEPAPLP